MLYPIPRIRNCSNPAFWILGIRSWNIVCLPGNQKLTGTPILIHTEGYLLRTMYNSTELRLAFLRIDKDYIYTRGRSLGCGTVYELTFNSSAIIVVIENTKFGVRAYLVVELRTTSGNALHLRYDLDLVQHSWY